MNRTVLFSLFCAFPVLHCDIDLSTNKNEQILSRNVRTTLYAPYLTGPALEVAVAVPLDNGRFNIFLSFCIGAHYGQPEYDTPHGIDPSPFKRIYEDTLDGRSHQRNIRSEQITRRKFYRVLSDNLRENGFNAKYCVLRAICEATQYKFSSENGVLGDFIHILFTPSTSKDEGLPLRYYEAERNGHLNLCELRYGKKCPVSLFDLISTVK